MKSKSKQIKTLGGVGILNEEDLKDFSKAEKRIINLMSDGKWHRAAFIIVESRQREGLRRLRGLRTKGYKIEKRRDGFTREFYYKLS